MTNDIQHQISQIIAKRRPQVQRIEQLEDRLHEITGLLDEINRQRHESSEQLSSNQAEQLQALDIGPLIDQVSSVQRDLQQLKARFSREMLNIGVVGRARQGKSRLLRSITGLERQEIPDGDRGHCTGARSTICHTKTEQPYADVFFYTEADFLNEIIKPYFIELKLGGAPTTLEQFANCPPPTTDSGAETGAKRQRLQKYHDNLSHYRSLLKTPSPKRISREQIPEYVAQHQLDNPDKCYFNYLAVREVRIFCPFLHQSVEQIAVVDMPGLGDTGVGDEARLIKALGQDIDFILFQRKPSHSGDYWQDVDVRLYDVASRALQELPLKEWSVQVLNRTSDGANHANCEDLQHSIGEHHIEVAKVLIANCADPTEVSDLVLQPILDYMGQHIARLDERYALAKQASLDELRQACLDLIGDINAILGIQTGKASALSRSDDRVFTPLYKQFWKALTRELDTLLHELSPPPGDEYLDDDNFNRGLAKAKQQAEADTGIPDLEGIETIKKVVGSYNEAYFHLLNIVRNKLTGHFQGLDAFLAETVEATKTKVAKALRDAGLANLSPATDSAFLADLMRLMAKDEGIPTLNRGFTDLAEFRLLYRGFVQHHIRKHLGVLLPDHSEAKDFEETAEGVLEKLQLVRQNALYKIEEALKELAWQPRMAVFAVVEEFCDRVLRAEDVDDEEWRYFLQDYRDQIWAEHFAWQNVLNRLAQTVTAENLSMVTIAETGRR